MQTGNILKIGCDVFLDKPYIFPDILKTVKDKIPKNSILARIFGLRQGYKDKSCPGQDFRETRTRWHP